MHERLSEITCTCMVDRVAGEERVNRDIGVSGEDTSVHTFQIDLMIVEDDLASKRGPNLLHMSIDLITDGLSSKIVLKYIFEREAGLDEHVP